MTSKKSFLVSMKENNKRRIWIWLSSVLFWFIYYPVIMAFQIDRVKRYDLSLGLSSAEIKKDLLEAVRIWFSMNEGRELIFVSLFAILCAVQGFSYLYSRKKVDLYHSVPVSKPKRFALISINSILIYLLPYLLSIIAALLIAGLNGAVNMQIIQLVLFGTLMNLLLFIATFGLTVIAVMLTGNLIITLFGTLVFLLYEMVVRVLLEEYASLFFEFYSYSSIRTEPILSPGSRYIEAIYKVTEMTDLSQMGSIIADAAFPILKLVLLAAVFLAIAYICYIKRPSEAAGKPMAFQKSKAVIKILITVPASLYAGLIVINYSGKGGSKLFLLIGFTLAVILINGIIEVMYELDIKAAFRKKHQILISGVLAAVVYFIFQFDLAGYDKWEPNPDTLKDAAVMVDNITHSQPYYDDNLYHQYNLNREKYISENMSITDIDAICELTAKREELAWEDTAANLSVEYRMNSGRKVYREFQVSYEQEEALNQIIGNEEFKRVSYQLYDDAFFDKCISSGNMEIIYNTGIAIENLSPEDAAHIRKLYLSDFDKADYSTLKNEYMCGIIAFSVRAKNGELISLTCDIYPSYTNVIGYLKEKGVYQEEAVAVNDIESITVTNYHYELNQNSQEATRYYGYTNAQSTSIAEDMAVSKTFTGEAQIKELLPALFFQEFTTSWKKPGEISDNYFATIQLKNGKSKSSYYRGNNAFVLITERIPEFVEKETAYK